MTEPDQRFAQRAIRRQRLFLGLSIAGLAIACSLTVLYAVLWWINPAFPVGPRAVIILLVLLNARQNLRQYKYSRILTELMAQGSR
jgi:CHASE2 domain-containing sensor protein